MNATVARSSRGAGECDADRDHAHDGEREQREGGVLPHHMFERGHDHRRAEQKPHEQREQLASVVGEADNVVVRGGCDAAERDAADECADEAVATRLDRQRVGNESETEHCEPTERGCAPAPSSRPCSNTAPISPTPRPTPAPMRRSTAAPPTPWAWAISAATAPARNRLTNGVAMPSFNPLSTLSTRRTRAGTRSSCMIDAPRAASVGATIAADQRGDPQVDASEQRGGGGSARCDRQRKTDPEETDREADVGGAQRTHVGA